MTSREALDFEVGFHHKVFSKRQQVYIQRISERINANVGFDIWAANKHMIIGYVVNSKFFVTYRGFTAEANGKGRGSLESQRHQSFGHSPVHFPG